MKSFFHKFRHPKLLIALSGLLVIVLFTAAYHKKRPMSYHSGDEMNAYRLLLDGDLPNGTSDMFIGSGKCAGCHGIDIQGYANVTAAGENVSPAENWRATMMANAAKDPMWLAKVAHEVAINPAHENELVNKCTSCHAPLGRFEAVHDGVENYTMGMLEVDSLALDGVSCMACHAQQIETTGNFFSGELHYNADTVWGPVFNILPDDFPLFGSAMQSFVGVSPEPNEKFSRSETCAGCHTLVTNTADLDGNATGTTFIEQATYHEWLNSDFNNNEENIQECQGCHMPKAEEPIVVASGYSFLPPRSPYGQHWLVGGNSFMLELMKNHITDLGITANESHFNTVIDRTISNLQHNSSELLLTTESITGDTAKYVVKVTNKAGHKLPSGYPSRRAYIEFVMTDEDGVEVFHSGKLMPGYEVQGQNSDFEPHYDVISDDENEVQIYEMVMGDVLGNVTTVLERAHHTLKDNRLVPLGFSTTHFAYDTIPIVGAAFTDPNFNSAASAEGTGTDEVHYHVPVSGMSGNFIVTARLMYQSLPPKWNQEMFSVDSPVINAFEEMYWEEGPDPVQMSIDETTSLLEKVSSNAAFFSVSPNPTNSGFVMVDAGKDVIVQLNVYTIDGRLIESIKPSSSRTQVKLNGAMGTYLLDVSTSRGRRVEKVMKR